MIKIIIKLKKSLKNNLSNKKNIKADNKFIIIKF